MNRFTTLFYCLTLTAMFAVPAESIADDISSARGPAPAEFSVDGDGNVSALSFSGDGSNLTNLPVDSPWIPCGNLSDLVSCELSDFPSTQFQYALIYNTFSAPNPQICTGWNRGFRIYNRDPYFVSADNPENGMLRGGTVFYTQTDAQGDNSCTDGSWRHGYWYIDPSNTVQLLSSNGCVDQELFCRKL